MKNKCYLLVILALCSLTSSIFAKSMKLTFKNGKEIDAISMKSFTPVGFDAVSKDKDGNRRIFKVYFKNLTPDLQKYFKYDTQKANAYTKKRNKALKIRAKKEEEAFKKRQKDLVEYSKLKDYLASRALYAQFIVIDTYHNAGVYVKASSPDSLVRKGKYGRVYILDFFGTRGVTFTRTVYPTGRSINFNGYIGVPVYACSIDFAARMLMQKIRANKARLTPLEQAAEGRHPPKTENTEKTEKKKTSK